MQNAIKMGVNGLLPLLKAVARRVHIKEFKGLKLGIDTYCWLHRAVHAFPLLNPDFAKIEKYGDM